MVHIFQLYYDNYDNNGEICSVTKISTYLFTRTVLANPFFNIGLFTDIFLSRGKVNIDFDDVFLFANSQGRPSYIKQQNNKDSCTLINLKLRWQNLLQHVGLSSDIT